MILLVILIQFVESKLGTHENKNYLHDLMFHIIWHPFDFDILNFSNRYCSNYNKYQGDHSVQNNTHATIIGQAMSFYILFWFFTHRRTIIVTGNKMW